MEEDDYLSITLERDNLHSQFGGGGLPKGTTLLMTGKDGAGKSAICQRFAYSLLKNGIKVTLISTELTTKGFIDQMRSLDYDIMEYLLDGRLIFIPVFPLFGQAKTRADFLGRLMNTKELYRSDVIMMDTFSSLIKNDIDEERAFMVIGFFQKLSEQSKNIIITMDPAELSETVVAPFRSVCDIYIELKSEAVEGNLEHTMFVKRFSSASGPVRDTVGFRVVPGAGFIVDITSVA